MSSLQRFGGNWTEEKLRRLEKYLSAYTTIFRANEWARRYTTYYVDAFAGSGSRSSAIDEADSTMALFDDDRDLEDMESFYRGSARIALEVEPSFDHFLFFEQREDYVRDLDQLRQEFPDKSGNIEIRQGEANFLVRHWCQSMDWNRNRAVVFLDPYGMSVNWETIEAIANTRAIDLWILFPLGQAVNRLLTRQGPPPEAWAEKLTRFFGTDSWQSAFYRHKLQGSLFDDVDELEKQADFESIGEFFVERLRTVFVEVSEKSLVLANSRNNPIFVLYFAASNPRGASTAVKIAEDILGRS